ncbi:hypothetical protein AGABI2DRAFT_211001 [Agaricus bisporus var. bisporus H97]|uniref:hypothetical protein n=1 Tax=Agaricus bisporus var. bisporus (strain H97 / ATCC MYA-4626 / FGSC 10389) TaxID=936046 RepID=UPI00029F706D|nr:hypothetical protein AGABI2DRAFT_211001 [Agaricus bisporus var. bisporus H97]EKV43188.1 hypothetical protein AGABI2DRAFT_211001 [Agaricus bisporus var. bisporus H97]
MTLVLPLSDPCCFNMQELASAPEHRASVSRILLSRSDTDHLSTADLELKASPLFVHLSHGLALTTGSALGSIPPTIDQCLSTYQISNTVGLTVGARAWTKHAHRSQELHPSDVSKTSAGQLGWWGRAQGSKSHLNQQSLILFWKIVNAVTWRNLHWLPHQVLVYEIRVKEGYGMRWSQDRSSLKEGEDVNERGEDERPWVFRGFVEPMIENGHEVGWRHRLTPPSASSST